MSRHEIIRKIPIDVVLVLVVLGLSRFIVSLGPGTPIRVAITLIYLLIVPGYVITTVAFPAKPPGQDQLKRYQHALGNREVASMADMERLAASFGISVALLTILGLLLTVVLGGVTERAVINATGVIVVLGLVWGAIRRVRLPEEIRSDFFLKDRLRSTMLTPPATDAILNIGLAVAILITVTGLGYAIIAPQDGSTYTSVSLLTENEDGELVASNYLTDVSKGDGIDLVLLVENHEQREMTYSAVIQLQRVSQDEVVTDSERIQSFQQTVPDRGSWRVRHTVNPTMTGDRIRLVYLLYRGEAPRDIEGSTPYRTLYLWLSVSE